VGGGEVVCTYVRESVFKGDDFDTCNDVSSCRCPLENEKAKKNENVSEGMFAMLIKILHRPHCR